MPIPGIRNKCLLIILKLIFTYSAWFPYDADFAADSNDFRYTQRILLMSNHRQWNSQTVGVIWKSGLSL